LEIVKNRVKRLLAAITQKRRIFMQGLAQNHIIRIAMSTQGAESAGIWC